jgi:CHAT domain-containing protein/tetratricopeptide (TPR) repeat protein
MWRMILLLGLATLAANVGPKQVRAQGADPAADLLGQVRQLYSEGKFSEALSVAERYEAITRQRNGEDHTEFAVAITWVARIYKVQGRYIEAEPLFKRALSAFEKVVGSDHPDIGIMLNDLAGLYWALGRYGEAEPLMKRALAIAEKENGVDHLDVGAALNNLAMLYNVEGRFSEAEPLFKRAMSIFEKALGPDRPELASMLYSLAGLYLAQGRYRDAELLFKRALTIREKTLAPDHRDIAASISSLGTLYYEQGRYSDAEPLFKRTLAMLEKTLGPDHADVGAELNNLAGLYDAEGRYADAEPLYKRSLAIREKALGPDYSSVGTTLNNLAFLYAEQGRNAEAEPLYKRSLTIYEKALGPDHPDVGTLLNNLAGLALAEHNWAHAADYWRRATDIIELRVERGLTGYGQGSVKGEGVRNSWYFWGLVKMTDRLAPQGQADRARQGREMFEKAQWAQASEAASSLAQMAARNAKGDVVLAGVVRERQDLVAEWQAKDNQLIAAKSELPQKRKPDTERSLSERLAAIDTRLGAIDAQLAKDFPDYASLSSPKPTSVAEVQVVLRENEALVLFLDTDDRFRPTPEETFIWVMTKSNLRWVRSELGTSGLQREVDALRCGLDYDGAWGAAGSRCAELLKLDYTENDRRRGKPLPFDLGRAHALYKGLFGEVEDLIKDKQLFIVPSGALNALPLQVLVTEKPAEAFPATNAGYAKAAWLGTRHALTVLPAVSSLKALRAHAKPIRATDPYIGFGNPLLTGRSGTDRRAWKRQRCPAPTTQTHVSVALSGLSPTLAELFRDGAVNVEGLRHQVPLPETADELCDVARANGIAAPDAVVNLGERATEGRVKVLSADGTLARARVVHFATHGLVAGETALFAKSHAEPALLLTPPATASEEDDGLLTASEVAALKLDADWVILSACNTAAADTVGGDALSGLARAFFYAGARALLVSHWPVDSQATVALITRAFEAYQANPKTGRAEALRRAMAALIKAGGRTAHPEYWAPFVVVGEGAR